MTNNEIWVVIVLGVAGYWCTSAFIKHFQEKKTGTKNQSSNNGSTKGNKDFERKQENNTIKNWYEILEVSPTSSLAEIKNSYRKKISLYHPDKFSSMGPEFNEIAQKKSKEINSAYDEAIRLKR